MSRGDLTEVEWRILKVLLPVEREPGKRGRGRPPKDNRNIINCVLPATWTGASSGEVYLFWQRIKPYYEKTREFVADYEQDGCGIGALIYSSKGKIPDDL